MSQEKIILQLPSKTIVFEIKNFGDSEVDTEELLQVDLNAIILDIATFPVLFNRLGIIKAEMDSLLRETQLDFDLFNAEERKKARGVFTSDIDSKGNEKKKFLTEQGIEDVVLLGSKYKVKRQQLNKVKYQADIIDALYWSAKSKDQKLNAISAKLKPEEFEHEIIEGVINGVLIKEYKNQFQQRKINN